MIIEKIKLYNFGSYEGINIIDTQISSDKNIVLFGGKNGAGKTTLFTAIRLCLYGHLSMGASNFSSKYSKRIKTLLNNKAKLKEENSFYVSLSISINNSRNKDTYELTRKWQVTDEVDEVFTVNKNGQLLNEQETADFEKYLTSLIPPELFNLYFFDGETITDFFTDKDGNKTLKEAFLILCGYDTFEIMENNFKRIANKQNSVNDEYSDYSTLKDKSNKISEELENKTSELRLLKESLKDIEHRLIKLDKDFVKKGGVLEKEWSKQEELLKEQEKIREEKYYELKKLSNEIIPFLIVKAQVNDVKNQIERERTISEARNFISFLNKESIQQYLLGSKTKEDIYKELIEIAKQSVEETTTQHIFDLSIEQMALVNQQCNRIIEFNKDRIINMKKIIADSLSVSAATREKMNGKSINGSNELINKKNEIINNKIEICNRINTIEADVYRLNLEDNDMAPQLLKAKKALEESLKNESITNITIKSLVMLEKLQKTLYEEKIDKLQSNFRKNITILMNKKDLINDLYVDEKFNFHIYQNESISVKDLKDIYENKQSNYEYVFNHKSIDVIKKIFKNKYSLSDSISKLKRETIDIPIEVNIENLSAGERQMFIMSIYLSLVQLSSIDIPFIIDTPFARIDKDHRKKITKNFFNLLNGQIMILSTNREIDKEHLRIMKKNISKTYTLKNNRTSATEIIEGNYFGETI